ncbi:MAG: hypothetical protein FWC38_00605 [Proteobacteria bacterium]|nr:hypothetical protein [Pseudomonadota bacterium]MCL2306742.1 hypothetical protein [Pseudomonadota bacterium]
MSFNISNVSNTFKRKVTLYVSNAKGTDDVVAINCDFVRWSKDKVQEVQDALSNSSGNAEGEAVVMSALEKVWTGWDVVDDNGPLEFNRENRERLFNALPGAMFEVFRVWLIGCSGRDRKNV